LASPRPCGDQKSPPPKSPPPESPPPESPLLWSLPLPLEPPPPKSPLLEPLSFPAGAALVLLLPVSAWLASPSELAVFGAGSCAAEAA
jgi:hypothetical protein